MNIFDAFPSRYLKAADLQGREVPLVIRGVEIEEIADGETRPVVYFENAQRGLVLNRTNATTIAGLYGPETEQWTGESVTLFPSETAFRGSMVECLRIRSTQRKRAPKRTPVAAGNGLEL